MRSASGSAPRPDAFSQEEVFENKVSFPRHQRAAAGAARYLAIVRLRTGFDFDDLVQRIAVRAGERIERRRSAGSHDDAPNTQTDRSSIK
jgi:hypothetical protein